MAPMMLADEAAFLIVGAAGATGMGILWVCLEFYRTRVKERTKREIAAYVAEGSITPEDGARLMRAATHESVNIDKELGRS